MLVVFAKAWSPLEPSGSSGTFRSWRWVVRTCVLFSWTALGLHDLVLVVVGDVLVEDGVPLHVQDGALLGGLVTNPPAP